MRNVSYHEMLKFLNHIGADMSPEIDCTYEDMIVEDYWNTDHTEVVAMTRHYNSGESFHFIHSDMVE